jgi:hypothetical protein
MLPTSSVSSTTTTASGSSVWSLVRTYMQLVRMGYGSRL